MAKRTVAIHNVTDFKDSSGNWVKSYTVTTDVKTQYHTRSGSLWGHIKTRCNPESKFVKSKQTYKDCSLGFEDFQDFAEWCQVQHGYLNKESNGNFWSIDKDILVFGNKSYSRETCIFVPNEINVIFTWLRSRKGALPVGVNIHRDKYRAYGANKETSHKHLGYFNDPFEAHKAWQEQKIKVLNEYAENMQYGEKICNALRMHANRIEYHLNNNIETTI